MGRVGTGMRRQGAAPSMRGAIRKRGSVRRRGARICAALFLAGLATLTAPPATADPAAKGAAPVTAKDDAAKGAATATATAKDVPASQSAFLAARLRESPVYLSDQLPRTVPRSSAPAFAKEAKRAGVPTYVMVLPSTGGASGLLEAVHDRLGKKGLYVLLDGVGGMATVAAFNVDVPAQDVESATTFELPYDAGAFRTFTKVVDIVRSGDAAERAGKGVEASRKNEHPDDLHTTRSERDDQSFSTGILLSGVPLTILATGWYVYHWRGRRRPGLPVLLPVAVGAAAVIGVGAFFLYDDTRSDGDPLPTKADMEARTERVADGLAKDPLYVDPLAPQPLTAAQRKALKTRLARLDVPVYMAALPMTTEDESTGHSDVLAKKLHERLGKDGVYVISGVDGEESVEIANYGAKVDSGALFRSTEKLRYGSGSSDDAESGGAALYGQLDQVLSHIADAPASARPDHPFLPPIGVDDPVEEDALPPLYSGQLTSGAVLGAFAALGALALTAAGLAVARRTGLASGPRSSGPRGTNGGPPRGASAALDAGPDTTPDAPARPSTGWLRRTARRELDELNEEFERLSEQVTAQVRARVWACLDAATLLLDQDGDSRTDEEADAPTLAAGLTLIRAGGAVLRDTRRTLPAELRLCLLNPLHGPAVGTKRLQLPGDEMRARARPVCAGCRAALTTAGDGARAALRHETAVTERLLLLRVPGRGRTAPHEPYDRLPGPLGATQGTGTGASLTIDQLVRRVREQLGVQ